MSSSLNQINLIGNLTENGELKVLADGKSILKVRLACNETWKNASGEKQEKVNFFNASLFGTRAVALAPYLRKGEKVFVTGSLQNSVTENSDGVKKYFTDVRINDVVLLGGKKQEAAAPSPQQAASDFENFYDDDQSIPF